MKLWLKILFCVAIVNVFGASGAFFTVSEIGTWYAELNKPPGVPPNWVFGPVWTVLYMMMGVSIALIWHRVKPGVEKERAVKRFAFQMFLNLIWTPVFFGAHALMSALGIIVILLVAIGLTIQSFLKVDRLAAIVLVPYFLWVCYATYLNAGYWWLNR